ncbi:MAG: DUF3048 domain-containing protein [Patescibacteria group bacterium]|nr:DUF3048 domain-containing protein [Patescibacteria group bacterium]
MDKKQKFYALAITFVLFACLVFITSPESWLGSRTVKIENENSESIVNNNGENNEEEKEPEEEKEKSLLNGMECANAKNRPLAVTLAGDLEAWPLSGISDADLVVEMPVVTGGITRYLVLYVCDEPQEIGSIRSARHDFIPLAMGFDAILAHWGGSHFALDKLNNKIMDNVNALYLDGSVFYRKPGLPKPHNGFTTIKRLKEYSQRIGYRMESEFSGYQFYEEENPSNKNGALSIGYPLIFKVDYKYNAETNSYLRTKGDKKDVDKLTSEQIAVKNVVIMYAVSRQIEGQYNDLDIEGEGKAIVYQNGWEIEGKWKKDKSDMKSKLYFYNDAGDEIKFVAGKIWIQVVEPGQKVNWKMEE